MSSTEENLTSTGASPLPDDGESREPAKVARRSNGDAVGVAVVLSPTDLRRLGINPDETDAVRPRIQSGVVLIETVG